MAETQEPQPQPARARKQAVHESPSTRAAVLEAILVHYATHQVGPSYREILSVLQPRIGRSALGYHIRALLAENLVVVHTVNKAHAVLPTALAFRQQR